MKRENIARHRLAIGVGPFVRAAIQAVFRRDDRAIFQLAGWVVTMIRTEWLSDFGRARAISAAFMRAIPCEAF